MPSQLTIVSAPTVIALTTIDAVRDEINPIDTSRDRYYLNLINRASRAIANYCHRTFGLGQYSEYFTLDRTEGYVDREQRATTLRLSRFPVISVESITDGYGNVVDPSTYNIDQAAGIITVNTMAPTSTQLWPTWQAHWGYPVTVAYHAGYDLATPGDGLAPGYIGIPEDLESIALAMVVAAANQTGQDQSVQLEVTENVGRTAYFDRGSAGATGMGIDVSMQMALANYKVYR
jgi:hypothetical protein